MFIKQMFLSIDAAPVPGHPVHFSQPAGIRVHRQNCWGQSCMLLTLGPLQAHSEGGELCSWSAALPSAQGAQTAGMSSVDGPGDLCGVEILLSARPQWWGDLCVSGAGSVPASQVLVGRVLQPTVSASTGIYNLSVVC